MGVEATERNHREGIALRITLVQAPITTLIVESCLVGAEALANLSHFRTLTKPLSKVLLKTLIQSVEEGRLMVSLLHRILSKTEATS
jgi:hypothetical protein